VSVMRRVVVHPGRIAVEPAGCRRQGRARRWCARSRRRVRVRLHAAHGRHPFVRSPTGRVTRSSGSSSCGLLWTPLWAPRRGSSWEAVYRGARPAWLDVQDVHHRARETCARTCSSSVRLPQGGMADTHLGREPAARVPESLDDHTGRSSSRCRRRCTRCACRRRGGRSVAVLGAGTIACSPWPCCVPTGAGKVVVTDPNPVSVRGAALGADAVADARSEDVAVRCGGCSAAAPTSSSIASRSSPAGPGDRDGDKAARWSWSRAGRGGHRPAADHPGPPDPHPGSATYLPVDYAESASLLSAGTIRKADFVTAPGRSRRWPRRSSSPRPDST